MQSDLRGNVTNRLLCNLAHLGHVGGEPSSSMITGMGMTMVHQSNSMITMTIMKESNDKRMFVSGTDEN